MLNYTGSQPNTDPHGQQALADRWTNTVETTIHRHHLDGYQLYSRTTPSAAVEVHAANVAAAYNLAGLIAGSGAIGINVRSDLFATIHTLVIAATPVTIYWSGRRIPSARGGRHVDEPDSAASATANHTTGPTS